MTAQQTAAIRRIGTCTAPAATLIEAREQVDGLAYGPIATKVYACDDHAHTARTQWVTAPRTAFTALAEPTDGHRCGDAIDLA